jgi:hypothetical protein
MSVRGGVGGNLELVIVCYVLLVTAPTVRK